ncbi:MAG: hypothetical protein Q3M30_16995 [Candidatus Electrothrix sp. Rat3]|nr:hypothetical protein [Candidatus Electrothrix rattekaaiensis]
MCNGLNFTKINQKRKELITSIFARFGSVDVQKERVAAVRRNDRLNIGQSEMNGRVMDCARTR